MYICITEVDAITKIVCTAEPQRTGPSMPVVKGWVHIWHDQSTWPVEVASNGTYLRAPKYYGICDDDADTSVAGVLKVLSQAEFDADKQAEHQARKPYPSWVGDIDTMSWQAPVTYPQDGKHYYWDESTINWVEVA